MIEPSPLEELFHAALEKPVTERAAFLDDSCRGNPTLRAEVERLLAAHVRAASFLEPPHTRSWENPRSEALPDVRDSTHDHTPQVNSGSLLAGKYKLLEEIGEGGMGAVWMAQQTEPIKRLVAVKVIKAGMDTKAVVARFDAERQALALMDHPNIARVFDAGSTPDGRPFFVMELVKGTPITEFCDRRRLTPRERLELLVPVCQAIQHAHQKGVIHRDIKPRNVLVALYDDVPAPKVIDFGVAKAVGQPLTDHTLTTGFGTVVGTPEYMSPEQATFNNLDIDTRSDVYSLGVLLYELLTGGPPISRQQMQKAGLLEVLRAVREEEPPRPSTRLSAAETLPNLAADRGMAPRQLTGLLRDELDWIVMKALEKDRRRRYESANSMAADVLRYLAGEPVQAVPPSLSYRGRKFVARHRGWVASGSAVALVLALGMGGTTWGLVGAERAKTAEAEKSRIANEQEAARLRVEADLAGQRHLDQLRLLRNRDAVAGSLSQVEIALRAGDAQRAAEACEQAGKRMAEGGADDLKMLLARCRADLAMLQKLDGIDSDVWTVLDGKTFTWEIIFPRWIEAFSEYGIELGAAANETAVRKIEGSFIRERLLASLELWFVVDGRKPALRALLAAVDPDEFRNACRTTSYQQAILSLAFRGRPQPSILPVWFAIGHGSDRTVPRGIRERLLLSAYRARTNSFPLLMTLGQLDDINDKESGPRRVAWYRAALAVYPANAFAWNNLGLALRDANDLAGAIAAFDEAIRVRPTFAVAFNNRGIASRETGDPAYGIQSFREAIRLDPALAQARSNLGMALIDTGDPRAAIAACTDALRLDPQLASAHHNLGCAKASLGDHPGAIASYKLALQLDPKLASAHNNIGNSLAALGNYSSALPYYKEAIRLDPRYAPAHNNLGMTLKTLGDYPGAIAAFREAIRLDPRDALTHTNLGIVLCETGNLADAISEHQEAIRLKPTLASAHLNLGAVYLQLKDYSKAIELARAAIRLDPKFSNAHAMLGFALQQTGDPAGARAALTEAARLNLKQWGPLLARLPPIPLAPLPRESKR